MTAGGTVVQEQVLVFLRREDEVLLGRKTRKIGVGLWNAPGGKVEQGEKLSDAVVREVHSEVGLIIDPTRVKRVAFLTCFTSDDSNNIISIFNIHVYFAYEWEEDPEFKDPKEMIDLVWTRLTEVPYEEMMPADKYWLPKLLALGPEENGMCVTIDYKPGQKELQKPVIIQTDYWLEQYK